MWRFFRSQAWKLAAKNTATLGNVLTTCDSLLAIDGALIDRQAALEERVRKLEESARSQPRQEPPPERPVMACPMCGRRANATEWRASGVGDEDRDASFRCRCGAHWDAVIHIGFGWQVLPETLSRDLSGRLSQRTGN